MDRLKDFVELVDEVNARPLLKHLLSIFNDGLKLRAEESVDTKIYSVSRKIAIRMLPEGTTARKLETYVRQGLLTTRRDKPGGNLQYNIEEIRALSKALQSEV